MHNHNPQKYRAAIAIFTSLFLKLKELLFGDHSSEYSINKHEMLHKLSSRNHAQFMRTTVPTNKDFQC